MSDGMNQAVKDAREQEEMDQRAEQRRKAKAKTMRTVTITEEEFDKAAKESEANQELAFIQIMKAKFFPPAPQWIFGREPTEEDADVEGDVAMPCFDNDRLWEDRHYDLMPSGVPFMKLPDAQVYTDYNPAPNPFERDLKTQNNK